MESTAQRSRQAARQARELADEAETMKEFLARLAEERRKREAELAASASWRSPANWPHWPVPSR